MIDTSFWGPIVSWGLLLVASIVGSGTMLWYLKSIRDQKLNRISAVRRLIVSLDSRVYRNSWGENIRIPLATDGRVYSEAEFNRFNEEFDAEVRLADIQDNDEPTSPQAIFYFMTYYGRLLDISHTYTRLHGEYDLESMRYHGKPDDMTNQDYEFWLECNDLWRDALNRFHDSARTLLDELDSLVSWNPFRKTRLRQRQTRTSQ
ncbi:MAG: hypothetical protein ACLP5H_11155 [Desulfomonilaceae bacterium]